MKVAVFSTKKYDQKSFEIINANYQHELTFFEFRLTAQTARMAQGFDAVCAFVNDDLSQAVLEELANNNVRLIAMRCAGFDKVDLKAAKTLGIQVVRVPAYSPELLPSTPWA